MGKPPKTNDSVRSRTMSRIKSKDTSIEVSLRKALWNAGIRYRKNYKQLPGSPDIAITKHRIAVFCDGEFWHGKDWDIKKPRMKSNRDYWVQKIERNIDRDRKTDRDLFIMDWVVIRFWGSDIQNNLSGCISEIIYAILQNELECYDDP